MEPKFNYQEEFSKCSTMEDITGSNGLGQRMAKDAMEQILQREMADFIADESATKLPPTKVGGVAHKCASD